MTRNLLTDFPVVLPDLGDLVPLDLLDQLALLDLSGRLDLLDDLGLLEDVVVLDDLGVLDVLFDDTFLEGNIVNNIVNGTLVNETIRGSEGNDVIRGHGGDDRIYGNGGADGIYGGTGNDAITGGKGNDLVYGDDGNDVLWGDDGITAPRGSDLGVDHLDGGAGNDALYQGDGNDVMTGGAGSDVFQFRWTNAKATSSTTSVVTITDFVAPQDQLRFDVAGVQKDQAGANFVDGGAAKDGAGGAADSFFSGAAASSNGQSVMVLTGASYSHATRAAQATVGEATGDLIVYFNSATSKASLAVVDNANIAHTIAEFSNIDTLGELASAGFTASDFVFV